MQKNIHLLNKLYIGQSSLKTELSSTDVKPFYIMKEETWKAVKNYEGIYEVSNLGNIKSLLFGKERYLKQGLSSSGYFTVVLHKSGIRKTRAVHQIIAESFLNHKPCGHNLVINHIDFNKKNNFVENLELVTNRENCNHKHLKKTSIYTGVHWFKERKKWQAQVYINGKIKHLGLFDFELEASNAYQTAIKAKLSQPIK